MRQLPVLSAIVLSRSDYGAIRRLMRHLRAQTARSCMELIFVVPQAEGFQPNPDEMAEFWGWQILECGRIDLTSRPRTLGVHAARAPLVVLTEEHCLPFPDWAEALIAAHENEWAVVGPVVYNANPRTAMSWAQFFLEYGLWLAPHEGGHAEILPGNNSCYRRELLLELGDRLEEMLDAETLLHWEFRRRGLRLRLEPKARAYHINMTQWRPFLLTAFHAGRRFAHHRALGWCAARRMVYFCGSPLIPAIRFRRILAEIRRTGRTGMLARILPPLGLSLIASAFGEMQGYVGVLGQSREYLTEIELDRERLLGTGDAVEIPDPPAR